MKIYTQKKRHHYSSKTRNKRNSGNSGNYANNERSESMSRKVLYSKTKSRSKTMLDKANIAHITAMISKDNPHYKNAKHELKHLYKQAYKLSNDAYYGILHRLKNIYNKH